MNEGTINSEIIAATARALRGAVVTKHADRSTRDIPDISVVYLGPTFYCETKLVRKGQTIKSVLRGTRKHTVTQLLHLGQLHTASDGRAWAVVYDASIPKLPKVMIWTPQALFGHAFPEIAPGHDVVPYCVNVAEDSTAERLYSHRAIEMVWAYDALALLIKQDLRRRGRLI